MLLKADKNNNKISIYGRNVLICTLLLSLFGMVMIYSASSYSAKLNFGDAFFYVKKQAIAFVVGLVFMLVIEKIDIKFIYKSRWIVFGISVVLLLILFIPGIGTTSYGATRWLDLKIITFQPSEIAKFALVILLSGELAEKEPISIKNLLIPLLCTMVVCVAIMMEPNMSVTICIILAVAILLFEAGLKYRYFAVLGGIGAVSVPILIYIEPYRMKRLTSFLDPWSHSLDEGYQIIQSYYALGSGGLFGVGLFASRQKYLFLPFSESDFIFSVIGEELGLIGAISVICIFLMLIVSGFLVASKADTRFKTLLAVGITAIIASQTLINIAVVSGSVPPTGIPLPYMSAGGSSLMVFMTASGILVNISKSDNSKIKLLCKQYF